MYLYLISISASSKHDWNQDYLISNLLKYTVYTDFPNTLRNRYCQAGPIVKKIIVWKVEETAVSFDRDRL